jgi:hypothetical protein
MCSINFFISVSFVLLYHVQLCPVQFSSPAPVCSSFSSYIFSKTNWFNFSQTVMIFLQSMPWVLTVWMLVRGAESAGHLFLFKDKKVNLRELWMLILRLCLTLHSLISMYVYHITEHDAGSSHSSSHVRRCSSSTVVHKGRQHVLQANLAPAPANRHCRKFVCTNIFEGPCFSSVCPVGL